MDPRRSSIIQDARNVNQQQKSIRVEKLRASHLLTRKQSPTSKKFVNWKVVSWSFDMKGRAEKCVERFCDLAVKSVEQLSKVSTPCMYDHQFTEDGFQMVGELATA